MNIEPMIAALIGAEVDAAALIDWTAFCQCPTCRAPSGAPCFALNGRVAGGQPDGVRTPLPRAHAHRRRRAGR